MKTEEELIRLFQMIADRPMMKPDDYYKKYPEYRGKIMNDASPHSGEVQIAKYALSSLSPQKKEGDV